MTDASGPEVTDLPVDESSDHDTSAPTPAISVVIAVHDEVENVVPLMDEIANALDGFVDYELVIVDDASVDGTVDVLLREAQRRPRLRVLRHDRCCGKSGGVWTGAWAARAPLLLMMDGDLQNDPQDAPALLDEYRRAAELDARFAMVAGQRIGRKGSALKLLSSRIANGVRSALLRDGTRDTGCGLKVVSRSAFCRLPYFDGQHRFMSALLKAQGHTISMMNVQDRPRIAGQTKYGLWNRVWVGIADLLAVFWILRRCHLPGRVVEPSGQKQDKEM